MVDTEHVTPDCQCEGKRCTKCKVMKCLYAFHRRSNALSGFHPQCKACRSEQAKKVNATPQAKARSKALREINHEYRHAYSKRYYQQRAEHIKARSRNNYHANPQQYMEASRRWHANNRERYKVAMRPHHARYHALRRTRKTQAGGSYTSQEWEALKAKHNYTCLCCGKKEPEIKLTPDHVIPVIKGGSSNIDTIQPLCKMCNYKKHRKIIDYRRFDDAIS